MFRASAMAGQGGVSSHKLEFDPGVPHGWQSRLPEPAPLAAWVHVHRAGTQTQLPAVPCRGQGWWCCGLSCCLGDPHHSAWMQRLLIGVAHFPSPG